MNETKKALSSVLDTSKSETLDRFFGPYTEKQVSEAFNLVADEKHWKNPVDAYIHPEEVELVSFAIVHFTATVPMTFETARHSNLVRIKAAGYYNGPAN